MSPMPIGRSRACSTAARTSGSIRSAVSQQDVGVVGADVLGDSWTYGRSGRAADVVGLEVLGPRRRSRRRTSGPSPRPRAQVPRGQRGQRAGVQPAGQQRAQRHVGDQLPLDDVLQQLADVRDRGRQVVGVLGGLQPPVALLARRPSRRDPHDVPGRTSCMPRNTAFARASCTKASSSRSPSSVDHRARPAGWPGSPWAPSRTARRRGRVVVQRLDAQPVADQHQLLGGACPRARTRTSR